MIAHATYEMPDLEPQIDYSYNANGDWTEARTVFTQFQNVVPTISSSSGLSIIR